MMRTGSEYQFDEGMVSAISDFATQTRRDAKQRRALSTLTFADVYWISKIENPLVRVGFVSFFCSTSGVAVAEHFFSIKE